MADESNFIVRSSGRKPGSFYIDYSGAYQITEVAKIVGLKPSTIKEIYVDSGAVLDEAMDVYYFGSAEAARKAISSLYSKIRPEKRGKVIFFTLSEVEYIRKALINEDANAIHVKKDIKNKLFEKLNR
jgi:hypothetical protein